MRNYTALGDSITFGQNASSRSKAYPSRVTSMLTAHGIQTRLTVIAEPSWTSADLEAVIAANPSAVACSDWVTIWIGGNDLIPYGLSMIGGQEVPIQKIMNRFQSRLDRIIRTVRAVGAKHILLSTQYNPFPNSNIAVNAIGVLNRLIASSAGKYRCQIARTDQWFAGNEPLLISGYRDGRIEDVARGYAPVHPNDEGHEVIAKGLFSMIYPLIRR
ncbi:SGNH/GDSL hydrolase family protein [Cohnella pontilimi]|uniref:SGNH/GDSL hydrolase family protein n=1 Tax=Cohnella pontilimi TaxID=2564100 RepID=A0A4U0FHY5_9BACL|nr:SGNH/GDSL hydrolase family protein [Cohnella pontilimi]TJY44064.1 SGNH/GDSL hydrolase family protein [Cohnella pontilimi]